MEPAPQDRHRRDGAHADPDRYDDPPLAPGTDPGPGPDARPGTEPAGAAASEGMRDDVRWHDAYDDPGSDLSARLRRVQDAIGRFLDERTGPVRVLSACAGQGHDILGVLDRRPDDADRVRGALVELDPTNAALARRRIADRLVSLRVVEADAGTTDAYAGLVPADLVLLVGIMGTIDTKDIERLVRSTPMLCAPGATVVWTRGLQEPDLVPDIRGWFAQSGFEEVSCAPWRPGTRTALGVQRLVGPPRPLAPGQRLFTVRR